MLPPFFLPFFLQPHCLSHDILMDAMWVQFPRGFDWVIGPWCYFFNCYGPWWLLLASPASLVVDPQLPISGIALPTGSFIQRVHLFEDVKQWIGFVGFLASW